MRMKKQPYISHYHRLNMINLSIKHLDWAMIDTNECFSNKFYYPTDTIMQLYNRIIKNTKLKKGQFDIIWLYGVDLGVASIPLTHKSFLRTICIDNRCEDQNSRNVKRRIEAKNKMLINNSNDKLPKQMYCKCNPLQLSSTEIRNLSTDQKHDELIEMFKQYNMEEVAHYIIDNNIYTYPSNDNENYNILLVYGYIRRLLDQYCSDDIIEIVQLYLQMNNDNKGHIINAFAGNNIINKFQTDLVKHGMYHYGKLSQLLTSEILTEYLKMKKYLKQNEKIVSYKYITAGENGFRGHAYRLFNFEIEKDAEREKKDWNFFLKVSCQPKGRTDEWFTRNEYIFYNNLYSSYNNSFCNLPSLIFCDYIESQEFDREINIILTEDLTDKVTFPFWYQDISLNKLILITRSLAEFHAKSLHEMDSQSVCSSNVMLFTNEKYISWVQWAAFSGERHFKPAYKGFKTINKNEMEFISNIANNMKDIFQNYLLKLCEETGFMCLVHGDAVITNILLLNNDNNKHKCGIIPWDYDTNDILRCIFIDWQTYVIGCPFVDLISVFGLLLIEAGSELEEKLFICYLDYLMRFGIQLKGVSSLDNENDLKDYYNMFKWSHIWAFAIESCVWAGKFLTKGKKRPSNKNKAWKKPEEIQQCVRKRLNMMMDFYNEEIKSRR
eukprot:322761_1